MFRLYLPLICLLVLVVPAPVKAAQIFALMDSSDRAPAFNKLLSLPNVDGVALRLRWDQLEPADGQFNWREIDEAFIEARAHGKKVTLHIAGASFSTPSWVFGQGAKEYLLVPPRGMQGQLKSQEPVPWTPIFLMNWSDFMQALSAHITQTDNWDSLAYISAGAPVPEMSLIACREKVMPGVVYSRASYMSSWKFALKALNRFFPETPKFVTAPSHHICSPDSDGAGFYKELMSDFTDGQFEIFANDLNGNGSKRLNNLGAYINTLPVGVRFTGAYSDPRPEHELGGSLIAATCQGLSAYKAHYIEYFKNDLLSARPDIHGALMIPDQPSAICLK